MNITNNFHDFSLVVLFLHTVFPLINKLLCQLLNYYKIIYIKAKFIEIFRKEHLHEHKGNTFSVPVLQSIFNSVLSIAISPKFKPENRAEKVRHMSIIKILSQSGKNFSYVYICK